MNGRSIFYYKWLKSLHKLCFIAVCFCAASFLLGNLSYILLCPQVSLTVGFRVSLHISITGSIILSCNGSL